MSAKAHPFLLFGSIAVVGGALASCSGSRNVNAKNPGELASGAVPVGVVKVQRKSLGRTLTVSSELVPFQEIDVYAKESGYVKQLNVDYGTQIKEGQLMAVVEIPALDQQR